MDDDVYDRYTVNRLYLYEIHGIKTNTLSVIICTSIGRWWRGKDKEMSIKLFKSTLDWINKTSCKITVSQSVPPLLHTLSHLLEFGK